jgi:transcriptional regulator with XRE-family HTH domain
MITRKKKTTKNDIGKKIKFYRERICQTQEELATESKLDPSTIARIENGTRNPDKETLYMIADALSLTPKETAHLFGINIYAIEYKKAKQLK